MNLLQEKRFCFLCFYYLYSSTLLLIALIFLIERGERKYESAIRPIFSEQVEAFGNVNLNDKQRGGVSLSVRTNRCNRLRSERAVRVIGTKRLYYYNACVLWQVSTEVLYDRTKRRTSFFRLHRSIGRASQIRKIKP